MSLLRSVVRLSGAAPVRSFSTEAKSGQQLYVWGGFGGWLNLLHSPFLSVRSDRPVLIKSPDQTGFRHIAFGEKHAAFVTGKGDVYTMGKQGQNVLGYVKKDKTFRLTKVEGLPPIKSVTAGVNHTICVAEDGSVWSFGSTSTFFRRVPLGREAASEEAARTPSLVEGLKGVFVTDVVSGSQHALALSKDGQVFGWGNGEYGRLGLGSSKTSFISSPYELQLPDNQKASQISSGSSFSAVLTKDGELYTFGQNNKGQLGLLQTTEGVTVFSCENDPRIVNEVLIDGARVNKDFRFTQVACGLEHVIALNDRNQLFFWGGANTREPTASVEKIQATSLAAGKDFSAFVTVDGNLSTWGVGSSGALGHGEKATLSEPKYVRGFGASPEMAGVSNASQYLGKAVKVFSQHKEYMAVLAE